MWFLDAESDYVKSSLYEQVIYEEIKTEWVGTSVEKKLVQKIDGAEASGIWTNI